MKNNLENAYKSMLNELDKVYIEEINRMIPYLVRFGYFELPWIDGMDHEKHRNYLESITGCRVNIKGHLLNNDKIWTRNVIFSIKENDDNINIFSTLEELLNIGFSCQKYYKRTVWKYANLLMVELEKFKIATSFDFGKGKGKWIITDSDYNVDSLYKILYNRN